MGEREREMNREILADDEFVGGRASRSTTVDGRSGGCGRRVGIERRETVGRRSGRRGRWHLQRSASSEFITRGRPATSGRLTSVGAGGAQLG